MNPPKQPKDKSAWVVWLGIVALFPGAQIVVFGESWSWLGAVVTVFGLSLATIGVLIRPSVAMRRYGITGIWNPRKRPLYDELRRAKRVWILKTWFPENNQIRAGFRDALQHTAEVKLLLCHPESSLLALRCQAAKFPLTEARICISRAVQDVSDAVKQGRREFGVGIYEAWSGCPIIRADNRLYMGFYFWGDTSPNFRWLRVRVKSPLGRVLCRQWDHLWKHCEDHEALLNGKRERRESHNRLMLRVKDLEEWLQNFPVDPAN